nr:hypothetical protein [Tanacetum cinerariifolium]
MENKKHQSAGSSSSSFTESLFGPKDNGACSSCHFGSVFGPSSTGLGKDSSHYKYTELSSKKQPSNLSSSIYYGGQKVYPPTDSKNTCSQPTFKKGGGNEDPNGNSAARGNWWQGSLYY